MKVFTKVLKSTSGTQPLACLKKNYNLYQSSKIRILQFGYSIFIYAGVLKFTVSYCVLVRKTAQPVLLWLEGLP